MRRLQAHRRFSCERGVVSAPSSSDTSPDAIADLWGWWRADLGITTTGLGVSLWEDQTSNGHDFAQSTDADRPAHNASDSNFGGQASVDFDSSNSEFLSVVPTWTSSTALDIYIVFLLNADPPGAAADTGCWRTHSTPSTAHFPFTDGNVYDSIGSTTRHTVGNPSSDMSAAARLYNVSSSAGSYLARLDTTQLVDDGTNTAGFSGTFFLGTSGSSRYLDGQIAEIAIYESVLSADDRSALETYFRNRYSLTGY